MTRPRRIYISGPMSGLPDLNFPAFHRVEAQLLNFGFEVVNPAKLNPPDTSYDQCMKTDIREMLTCDTILLIPGWETSKGAHLELHIAHRVGMKAIVLPELSGAGEFVMRNQAC